MVKVIVLQNELSAYRVETYNKIAEIYDLTLAFWGNDKSVSNCIFHKKRLHSRTFWHLTYIPDIRKICSNYDVVIFGPDLHTLSCCLLPFMNRKFKTITWSIGFRVSYTHPYITNRSHNLLDWLMKKIMQACEANIIYFNKSREFWRDTNLRMDNVFQAINTTSVLKIEFQPERKKDFLFVGTLYKKKGVDLLLNAFCKLIHAKNTDTKLHIVGDGEEMNTLKHFVIEKGLNDHVVFYGAIFDEKELSQIFQKALICISPTQGGLSVPKSMGYGVPFVTKRDAITGGEIYHITSNENGIIYDNDEELIDIMADAINSRQKYIDMGIKAMDYYYNNATVEHMANGAIKAIEFSIK